MLLQGRKVSKVFAKGSMKNEVLSQVDVDIYEKDFTIIMGSSGAGKSTLLYTLSGMDAVTDGTVIYKEKEISRLKEKKRWQGYGQKNLALYSSRPIWSAI